MALQVVEVIGVDKAYKPSRSKLGFPLKLGAVKIRMANQGGGPRIERFAYPLFNFMQTPLIGEHILVVKGPQDIKNPASYDSIHYYIGPVAMHGNKHLNPLPGSFDIAKEGSNDGMGFAKSAGKAVIARRNYKPGSNFKEKKTILNLQPYEGDILIEGRNGNAIRIGCAMGVGDNPMNYSFKNPFFKGKKSGSPILIFSNGHKEGGPMAKMKKLGISFSTPDYGLEDPDETDSIFIMSKDHKIDMKLAKSNKKIGKNVSKLSTYLKPQIIGSSERIILNAKKDEIVLISKKDIKVVTKGWATDMEEFFDQVLEFMDEVIKQNKELEKLHKELGAVAQSNATSIHPTGVGPSGPPTNAGSFIKSKGKATAGANKTKSLRKTLEKIRDKVKNMKV
jgi:hypothetical protein